MARRLLLDRTRVNIDIDHRGDQVGGAKPIGPGRTPQQHNFYL